MPTTPNHGYNVPNEGEEDWHVPLNENFEQYDTDIEIRDTESNRGNYDPEAGAKFLATDTEEMFIGSGSSWKRFRSSGLSPTLKGLDILGELSVEDGSDTSSAVVENSNTDDITTYGLSGISNSTGSASFGVIGKSNADSGFTFGLGGFSDSPDGGGVYGFTEDGFGVYGRARGSGFGLYSDGPAKVDGHIRVSGQNNWNLDSNDGDFEIGDDDYRLTMGVALGGGGAGACNIRAKGGIKRLNLGAGTSGHTVQIDPDAVSINGDLDVSGNKNFVQAVDTDDGEREVAYTASEAPTARTEVSGVAQLSEGRVEVVLPEHFGWVTSDDEPVIAQITPHADEPVRPQVTERSTESLVIEDFSDGAGTYEVSYTVKGTREGHADKQVVREPATDARDSPSPTPADD